MRQRVRVIAFPASSSANLGELALEASPRAAAGGRCATREACDDPGAKNCAGVKTMEGALAEEVVAASM